MPRRTRTQRQRRLEAYKQRQRERDLTQLVSALWVLWWQCEEANDLADQDADNAGYVDPKLTLRSPGVA